MTKEELKQEAEEYISSNCKRWEFDGLTVDDIVSEVYLAGAEPREKRIEELEKENAELKKKKEEIEIMTEFCKTCKQMHTDQLTKAKEIIKELLDFDFLPDIEIKKQAEQFLKDQEEEPCGQ